MIKCLVLDGWHKGHLATLSEARPVLNLIRPPVITIDDCCDGEEVSRASKDTLVYQLAFVSRDGKSALYSTDGSSDSIFNRMWIVPEDKNWVEQPLYVGIHDDRAVMSAPTPAQEVGDES